MNKEYCINSNGMGNYLECKKLVKRINEMIV